MARIKNITISVDTTNAAFCDDLADWDFEGSDEIEDGAVWMEFIRIVSVALGLPPHDAPDPTKSKPLFDYNGNTVGSLTITREGES